MTNNIMLDLETMGNGSNAAIIAIGAAKFNDSEVIDTFYKVVNLESSLQCGLEVDASTVLWWMAQSDAARSEFLEPGEHLAVALTDFAAWVGETAVVWGNGAEFDNAILANAYRKCALQQPWKHWNSRCYRTKKAEYPNIKVVRVGTRHNAVDDAVTQANHLIAIWEQQYA